MTDVTVSAPPAAPSPAPPSRLRSWLLAGQELRADRLGAYAQDRPPEKVHSWWKVMCLTGVDYFSTLGYQPGIAALAAGVLSPIATLVLVALTLLGALPVYRRVAQESPHGQGSIAMLERLLTFWRGKLFVLVLLGFAATDFVITITLSAADAAEHAVENPAVADLLHGGNMWITLGLIALLGVVFLVGFTEAIGIAVVLVGVYLLLNVVTIAVSFVHVFTEPQVVTDWSTAMVAQHGNPVMIVALALLIFPKLALGMSGFETGVAVMSHVKGDPTDTPDRPAGRIRNTKKLLTAAAVTMSCFLVTSSLVTTWLIPQEEFADGGAASGRALAYLAHSYLGPAFGTVYDLATIAILWFAGASAMAGLLNLIPRYLPRYGMAPEWAAAARPLVLVITAIAFLVTWIFDADVNAQGGAYATGVLVLFSSACVAVTLAARKAGQRRLAVAFGVITLIFFYTTALNVFERPDGVKIGAVFILVIVLVSLVSRLKRSFELRTTDIALDHRAQMFVRECARRHVRLVANEPDAGDINEYQEKANQIATDNDLPTSDDIIFVEVTLTDPSDFESVIEAKGVVRPGGYRAIMLEAPSVANALAALLLHIRDVTGVPPHIYYEWTEGNPISNLLRFLLFGAGEVAPVTREILRRAEPDRAKRPHVHAG
ncbi:amino acid transporter [Promicromonospora sp. NPDC057138]|uniref:amino acid transporter n=1 Tax=Promicromonospora sp. NPDC057138 TaxID=3346031 RepID=UPI0036264FE2